jgi:hypothetical protein
MLHAKAMAIVVAYDIYKELAEGGQDEAWKVDKPVDFYTFRETLARLMLGYSPHRLKYLGDEKFRSFTKLGKSKRARSPVPVVVVAEDGTTIAATTAGVTVNALKSHSDSARLSCGFLADITEHYDSCQGMEDKGKKLTCAFCGKSTYQFCGLCGVAVHKFPQGESASSCFFLWHDAGCFGLARSDFKITNKKMKEWAYPTVTDRKTNEEQMKRLSDHVARSRVVDSSGNNGGGDGSSADSDSD